MAAFAIVRREHRQYGDPVIHCWPRQCGRGPQHTSDPRTKPPECWAWERPAVGQFPHLLSDAVEPGGLGQVQSQTALVGTWHAPVNTCPGHHPGPCGVWGTERVGPWKVLSMGLAEPTFSEGSPHLPAWPANQAYEAPSGAAPPDTGPDPLQLQQNPHRGTNEKDWPKVTQGGSPSLPL